MRQAKERFKALTGFSVDSDGFWNDALKNVWLQKCIQKAPCRIDLRRKEFWFYMVTEAERCFIDLDKLLEGIV